MPWHRRAPTKAVFHPPLAGIVVILGLVATLTFPATSGKPVDAAKLIDRVARFYNKLDAMHADITVTVEVPEEVSESIQIPTLYYDFAMKRPARVSLRPQAGRTDPTLIQDGKRQYTELTPLRRYTLEKAARSFEAMLGSEQGLPIIGAEVALRLAMAPKSLSPKRNGGEVRLIGSESIQGTDCYHIGLSSSALDGELWIAKGDQPWVLRFRQAPPPDTRIVSAGAADVNADDGIFMFVPRVDVRFANWSSELSSESLFKIRPREGFTLADTLYPPADELTGMDGVDFGAGLEHDSVGQLAPNVMLRTLGDEQLELNSLKGNVVLLEFWASWCKPCVNDLPRIAGLADELSDRGVMFYAINRLESADTVRRFLADQDLEIPVVLDVGDDISRAFGVNGIPHTVTIDRSGKVRHVMLGSMIGGDRRLREQLESLLDE